MPAAMLSGRLSLTKRYVVALLLIAGLATSAFLILTRTLENEESRAEIINIAGKQRMLSQRITLMISELALSEGEQDQAQEALRAAVAEFETAHKYLTSTVRNTNTAALYFDQNGVDEISRRFISDARSFLRKSEAGSFSADDAFRDFTARAKGPVLAALDSAVTQFEKEGTKAINRLKTTELMVFLATIILLIVEAALIFMPANREIDRLFRKEQKAREEAVQSAHHRQIVLDSVGHELRTPLNAIFHAVQEMSDLPHSEQLRLLVKLLKDASEDIEHTLQHIMNFRLLDQQDPAVQLTTVEFPGILADLCARYKQKAHSKGLLFTYNPPTAIDQGTLFRTDVTKISAIISSLLDNAVKFTESGSIEVSAFFEQGAPDDTFTLTVKDTGCGIEPPKQANIFQPFVSSAKDGTSQRGLGLGLAMAHAYVNALGGDIRLISAPDVGSEFTLTVPMERSIPTKTETSPSTTTASNITTIQRCLLAEDIPVNQIIAAKALNKRGFEVEIVGDGASAIEVARRHSFDLIVLDIVMPKTNGVEVCKTIKKELNSKAPPIIAYTANCTDEDRVRYHEAGFDQVVGKPLKPDELDACLVETGFTEHRPA